MLYNLYTMLHKNSPVSCYDYKMQTSARYLQGISEPKVLRNVPIADFFSPVTVNVSKHKYVKLDDTYKAYFICLEKKDIENLYMETGSRI